MAEGGREKLLKCYLESINLSSICLLSTRKHLNLYPSSMLKDLRRRGVRERETPSLLWAEEKHFAALTNNCTPAHRVFVSCLLKLLFWQLRLKWLWLIVPLSLPKLKLIPRPRCHPQTSAWTSCIPFPGKCFATSLPRCWQDHSDSCPQRSVLVWLLSTACQLRRALLPQDCRFLPDKTRWMR